ncbi:STAS/SEC14 domain-containing protein [Pseudarthrobacter sp. RMG13]|uniref:STAS/SEC14 domain-containing protein n=1 Tax=Pseudarthrobacter humi TaxID=2952523 RepID=A0ABT1LMP6_9MICC|nr:STAS/SEC14 domain-containing protein [Pseudarthrobacter humi]MCP8999724.1 STAS/SEC14 domain-containing protein [Pseudarthrobacter humi]
MTSQPAEAAKADLTLDERGVIQLKWPRGASITESDAEAAMQKVNDLCGARRHPMLVDMATTAKVSRGARTVFGRPCQAFRIALLGASPVDRVLANFILGINKVPCPTRFFTSRDDAMAWLLKEPADTA